MQQFFRYLTVDDERLLLEKAKREKFSKNEAIVDEGSRRQAIFIIRKGQVRVEKGMGGPKAVIAHLVPGDVFGEMSFLENVGASASVLADRNGVEVDVLEGFHVHSLLTSVPGLSTRFFQSLAVTLSERLRDTSALIPSLMLEEIPHLSRFRSQRTGDLVGAEASSKLKGAVEEFKEAILASDKSIMGVEVLLWKKRPKKS